MPRYIDAEKIKEFPIRADHCDMKNGNKHFIYGVESVMEYIDYIPTADVREIGKDQWHILSDDPNDETGAPTEEGNYLVIDENGNEYVDYFYGEPRMTERGFTYWRDSEYVIKAWIKSNGKDQKNDL